MLPRRSSILRFQVPERQFNADKSYPLTTSSWCALLPVLVLQNHCTALLSVLGGWEDAAGY